MKKISTRQLSPLVSLVWLAITLSPLAVKADLPGAKDPENVKRYENSELIGYRAPVVDEFTLPLGIPTEVGSVPKFEKSQDIVGRVSRYAYVAPSGVTAAALFLNYKAEFSRLELETLFTKKPGESGWFGATLGKPSEEDGLSQMLCFNEDEERVLIAKTKGNQPIYYYLFVTAYKDGLQGAWDKRVSKGDALAYLQIIAPEKVAEKMVFVDASTMATEINNQGRVVLYGLYFDTDKDVIRSDSQPTMSEIAKLLKADSTLKLHIVGHTDNQGKPDYNLDLSRRRAASVVSALSSQLGISASRLGSYGCGLYAPVASNASAEGQAKNRRVELVKQ